jgi:hypothetical protein
LSEAEDRRSTRHTRDGATRAWLAAAALVIGAAGLVMTAVHQAAGPFDRPPPIEQAIADKAKSIYERAREAFRSEAASAPVRPPAPPAPSLDQRLLASAAALGALAIALALSGFARGERVRACAAGLVLGIAALPWQTGVAVVVAIACVAVASRAVRRGPD